MLNLFHLSRVYHETLFFEAKKKSPECEVFLRHLGDNPGPTPSSLSFCVDIRPGLRPEVSTSWGYACMLRELNEGRLGGRYKNCPAVFPGVGQRLHWPFEDPAAVEGSADEKMAKFGEVRDQIKRRIKQ